MIRDYKYVATDIFGKTIKGTMEAPNKKILARFLTTRGLSPKEINETRSVLGRLSKIQLGKTIKNNFQTLILKFHNLFIPFFIPIL